MIAQEIMIGLFLVTIFSLIYTLLDKRFPAIRMGWLYRENSVENFFVNFAVVGVFYVVLWFFI